MTLERVVLAERSKQSAKGTSEVTSEVVNLLILATLLKVNLIIYCSSVLSGL